MKARLTSAFFSLPEGRLPPDGEAEFTDGVEVAILSCPEGRLSGTGRAGITAGALGTVDVTDTSDVAERWTNGNGRVEPLKERNILE
ncbi:hypothetical protein J0910_30455 [Nocardiopsis sp. CNT-189]|uniref:hypothetical protein n=1 Tax=Nocardiopsis oceanisediminis TaxID=2816862 RepID=UPI003B374D71